MKFTQQVPITIKIHRTFEKAFDRTSYVTGYRFVRMVHRIVALINYLIASVGTDNYTALLKFSDPLSNVEVP